MLFFKIQSLLALPHLRLNLPSLQHHHKHRINHNQSRYHFVIGTLNLATLFHRIDWHPILQIHLEIRASASWTTTELNFYASNIGSLICRTSPSVVAHHKLTWTAQPCPRITLWRNSAWILITTPTLHLLFRHHPQPAGHQNRPTRMLMDIIRYENRLFTPVEIPLIPIIYDMISNCMLIPLPFRLLKLRTRASLMICFDAFE